jgi:predicted polyphosphate/ATP-dependent NAD kinase
VKRLGLIVNPVAGLGGRVGLKGSDGPDIQQQARLLGAEPQAQVRTDAALEPLRPLADEIELLTPPGEMGEAVARRTGFHPRLLPADDPAAAPAGRTTAEDTRRAARRMREAGADLILFAGGDGTARDIHEAIGADLPALGIPAGVKIWSAAFAVSPRRAGELAAAFLGNRRVRLREAEVIDLDEAAYREGRIVTRLYGYLRIPYRRGRIQNQKVPMPADQATQLRSIAADVIERMAGGRAYLLGPGTTTRAVAERLGLSKTLVGVDIVTRDECLALDVGERQILELLERRPLGLILTPTGGQGFLFGRGNQPLSPAVLRRVGRPDILIVCPAGKLAALQGRPLLVDTGDIEVDRLLAGYSEVVTGYHEKTVYKVTAVG